MTTNIIPIISVVGARPQFIKSAALVMAFSGFPQIVNSTIHTGQHYDDLMSDVFFDELGIPSPEYRLATGSGTHGAQTGAMLIEIEKILIDASPRAVIVYGDTNTTLAAALAAAKLNIPLIHIEAGLRSFDRTMPEEINRVVTDRLSQMLFCPDGISAANLRAEGISDGIHISGDIMVDTFNIFLSRAREIQPAILGQYGLTAGQYCLATVHRAANTDNPATLDSIIRGLAESGLPILLPLHPRTAKALDSAAITIPSSIIISPPLPYISMMAAVTSAAVIATDSGGLQKEAYLAGIPCVTLRDTTEWTATVATGWNILAGTVSDDISRLVATHRPSSPRTPIFGDGAASHRIATAIMEVFGLP